MTNLKTRKRVVLYSYPPLPEIKFCWMVVIGAILYGWMRVYQASQQFKWQFGDLARVNQLPLIGQRFKVSFFRPVFKDLHSIGHAGKRYIVALCVSSILWRLYKSETYALPWKAYFSNKKRIPVQIYWASKKFEHINEDAPLKSMSCFLSISSEKGAFFREGVL